MHYLAWVIANSSEQVNEIMAPYEEELNEQHGFWDWFVIGGRWSNQHQEGDDHHATSAILYNSDDNQAFVPSELKEGDAPYTLVSAESLLHRETYDDGAPVGECFKETANFNTKVAEIISMLQPDQSIYIVDYHS